MKTYFITYDLNSKGQDYQGMYKEIEKIGNSQHPLESVWFVKSNLELVEIYRLLKQHIDNNDNLFISQIYGDKSAGVMKKEFWSWL